jgi:hypothetical protein
MTIGTSNWQLRDSERIIKGNEGAARPRAHGVPGACAKFAIPGEVLERLRA